MDESIFDNVVATLDAATPPTKKRKSSTGAASAAGHDDSAVKERPRKNKITFLQKSKAETRSVKCGICGLADNSPDPVDPSHCRIWGSYKEKKGPDGKNISIETTQVIFITDGPDCLYCTRTYSARYMLVLMCVNPGLILI